MKQQIEEAYQLIKPYIHQTPVLTSRTLDQLVGAQLFFKCENFQRGGAYKARGACYNLLKLNEEERLLGVCTQSSGNHGACLALMSREFNINCTVVMPNNSAPTKIQACQSYEANIIMSGPTQKDREEQLHKVQQQNGCIYIPPYDSLKTIIGAGTTAYEFQTQQKLDIIIVPLGGGGLTAGTIIASTVEVIAVEPELAADGVESLRTGVIQDQMPVRTIADGLRTKIGINNFPFIQQLKQIWTVSEEEIIQATFLIWQRLKIYLETSSATVLAAAIKNKEYLKGKRVGLILSGGNVDLSVLKQFI